MQSRVSSAASLAIPCVGEQQLSLWLCCIHPHNPTRCRLSRQSCLNDLHKSLLCCAATLPFVAPPGVSLGGRPHNKRTERGKGVGTQNRKTRRGARKRRKAAKGKEKLRQTLWEHGCRAGRMRKHAGNARAGTRQTVGYADKQRKAFGNLTSTLARSADGLLRMQAFCQEGGCRTAVLSCVELCSNTVTRRGATRGVERTDAALIETPTSD